jgi:hypothetical protein
MKRVEGPGEDGTKDPGGGEPDGATWLRAEDRQSAQRRRLAQRRLQAGGAGRCPQPLVPNSSQNRDARRMNVSSRSSIDDNGAGRQTVVLEVVDRDTVKRIEMDRRKARELGRELCRIGGRRNVGPVGAMLILAPPVALAMALSPGTLRVVFVSITTAVAGVLVMAVGRS